SLRESLRFWRGQNRSKNRQRPIKYLLHSSQRLAAAIEGVRLEQDISPAIGPAVNNPIPGIVQETLPVRSNGRLTVDEPVSDQRRNLPVAFRRRDLAANLEHRGLERARPGRRGKSVRRRAG